MQVTTRARRNFARWPGTAFGAGAFARGSEHHVDHDNNVLTSQGEYQPIKRCGAGIGRLQPHSPAASPQSASMSIVVAIPSPQPR
jgi:hypothetical protein